MWKRLLHNLLPVRCYEVILRKRRAIRRLWLARLPKTSEADFRRIVTDELGLHRGAVVFIHSSVGWLNLGFSYLRVLPLLQEIVGPGGTLLFPCTHLTGRAEDALRRGEVFDVRNSTTSMGVLPELARQVLEAHRSLHPTNSVVAVGKHAEALTEAHVRSIYPCGENSPYYKIIQYNGLIVGLGVTTATLSFVHCVEDIWQERFPVPTRTKEVFQGRVIDWDGSERFVPTLAQSRVTQLLSPSSVPRFVHRYISRDICRDIQIHGVNYFVAHARALYSRMEELTSQGITIYGTFARPSRSCVAPNPC